MISKVNKIFLLLGEGFNLISVVVTVIHEFLILVNVVKHMAQSHLRLHPLLPDLFGVCESVLLVELLLDGREQLEAVLRGIVLHVLEEVAVDHAERQLLEGLHLAPVHQIKLQDYKSSPTKPTPRLHPKITQKTPPSLVDNLLVMSPIGDVSFIIIRMAGVEQGFLVYDAEWVEVSEQQLLRNGEVYKKTSIFNPVKASSLDPKDPDLLNKMFEPYVFETEGKFYRLNVSRQETSRSQLEELQRTFQGKLVEKQARKSGICPIREEIHNELFDEIIRQATVNLPERGILLMRVRDNLKMTFAAYQTLYEGSLVFGNRKAHVAELGISELDSRIEKLRKKKVELENQKILLENELSGVQQGFREIKVIEEKGRNDEVVYLTEQTKRLEDYLNGIYGD